MAQCELDLTAARKPCRGCGGPKGPARGHIYCAACRDELPERHHQERLARNRKPCERCGGPKPPGRSIHLCDSCRVDAVPKCASCGVNPLRGPLKQLCDGCHAESVRRKRERNAAWKREYRDETLGLRYGVRVPSAPLGEAVRELARRETCANPLVPSVLRDTNRLWVVCERAGIPERSLFAWGSGERPAINLYTAIGILDRLDLMWWEVWTEKSVPDPWALERARLLFEATSDAELKAAAFMVPSVRTLPQRVAVAA